MITFVLAAAVLVGALCVAAALGGPTTEAPPGVVASHVLAAGMLAADHTVPVTSKAGQERAVTVCEAGLTTRMLASS